MSTRRTEAIQRRLPARAMARALTLLALGAAGAAALAAMEPAPGAAASSAHEALPFASASSAHEGKAARKKKPAVPVERIDINGASLKQLMTLPGVGAAEARKIIANRPYLSKAELVQKGVLPTGPYLSLKDRVIALQKSPPRTKS